MGSGQGNRRPTLKQTLERILVTRRKGETMDTPEQALETLLFSIKMSTEEAHRTTNPLAMIYHYDSHIVQAAVEALKAAKLHQNPS